MDGIDVRLQAMENTETWVDREFVHLIFGSALLSNVTALGILRASIRSTRKNAY